MMMSFAFVFLLYATSVFASFDQIEMIANIETIGIVVTGDSLPDSAAVSYRGNGGAWRVGHPLLKIDGSHLAGSLFDLTENTMYELTVTQGMNSISGSVATQFETIVFAPGDTIYVDDDAAPGGNGSQQFPYRTIQDGLNIADAGTCVMVSNGVYHEAATFERSGTPNNWIKLIAAGDSVILDGSEVFTGNIWTPHLSVPNVWTTNIHASIAYLARDTLRYYLYDNLVGLLSGVGHENVPMSEGWYMSESDSILTIRSLTDPATHIWRVPRFDSGIAVYDMDWLWIEGFTIRYYGSYWGIGIEVRRSSNVVIRNNIIHNVTEGIFAYWDGTDMQGNNMRIEFNDISDPPVESWPWFAVKGTTMEGLGILAAQHKGAIVRGNRVHHLFNGVYTGRWGDTLNYGISHDVDVYDNVLYNIGDDAFEPEGTCINNRFRDNLIDSVLVGISLAPITVGPTWVMRNQVTDFFGTCLKMSSNTHGVQLIYHNTFWTNFPESNGIDFSGPSFNTTMRNNICRSTRYAIEITFTGNTGHDWDWDNWHTTRGPTEPHFKWENIRYDTIEELCAATGLECHGHEGEPGLTDPATGDVTLQPGSPNIDAGVLIQGINENFVGAGPDIGAHEFGAETLEAVNDFTISVVGSDVWLNWSYGLPDVMFTVFSTSNLSQPFETFVATTTATEVILANEITSAKRYYIVVVNRP